MWSLARAWPRGFQFILNSSVLKWIFPKLIGRFQLLQFFDSDYYASQKSEIKAQGFFPLRHYLERGAYEGRDPHPLFCSRYYLESYPDVARSGLNPLVHYFTLGARKGHDPHPSFDTRYYLLQNPDVARAGINPLFHFIQYGAREGRKPCPPEMRIWADPELANDLAELLGGGWDSLIDSKDLTVDLAAAGRLESAVSACRRALQRNPFFEGARLLLARLLLRMSRLEEVATAVQFEIATMRCRPIDAGFPRRQIVAAELRDVRSWCHDAHLPCTVLGMPEVVHIQEPKFLGENNRRYPHGDATLRHVYLAEIGQVSVLGGTNLLLAESKTALYDELALAPEGRYGIKPPIVTLRVNGQILIEWQDREPRAVIPEAIHFCEDHSVNYFHWLIECLPRLWVIEQFPDLAGVPLLVDAGLPAQQMEALQAMNSGRRPLVFVKRYESAKVERLFYPSELSILHDNYVSPVRYDQDIVISPRAVRYVRHQLLERFRIVPKSSALRIYVTRKKATYRKLENEPEVEEMMKGLGFTIIDSQMFTLQEQIQLFSEAEIVVGPTGAGLANILFAPEGCKVVVLSSDNAQSNFYFFNQIANVLDQNLYYYTGREFDSNSTLSLHNNYYVSVRKLSQDLETLL